MVRKGQSFLTTTQGLLGMTAGNGDCNMVGNILGQLDFVICKLMRRGIIEHELAEELTLIDQRHKGQCLNAFGPDDHME